jgi:hypothetical protein
MDASRSISTRKARASEPSIPKESMSKGTKRELSWRQWLEYLNCRLVNLPLHDGGLSVSVRGGEECRHEWVGSGEVNQDGLTCKN